MMFVKVQMPAYAAIFETRQAEYGVYYDSERPSEKHEGWLSVLGLRARGSNRSFLVRFFGDDEAWEVAQKRSQTALGQMPDPPAAYRLSWALLDPNQDGDLIVTTGDLFLMGDDGKTIERVR